MMMLWASLLLCALTYTLLYLPFSLFHNGLTNLVIINEALKASGTPPPPKSNNYSYSHSGEACVSCGEWFGISVCVDVTVKFYHFPPATSLLCGQSNSNFFMM